MRPVLKEWRRWIEGINITPQPLRDKFIQLVEMRNTPNRLIKGLLAHSFQTP